MSQLRLNYAMSRNTDPSTSDLAESNHIKSGKRKRNCDLILDAIKSHPDCTSAELGQLTGLDRVEAARRCSDLKENGLVDNLYDEFGVIHCGYKYHRKIFKRKCRVTKSLCIVWRIV